MVVERAVRRGKDLMAYVGVNRESSEVLKRAVDTLRETSRSVKEVKGLKSDETRGDRIKVTGLTLLTTIWDPFQIATTTGATLYVVGAVISRVERKSMGILDVVRKYRKLNIMLRDEIEC